MNHELHGNIELATLAKRDSEDGSSVLHGGMRECWQSGFRVASHERRAPSSWTLKWPFCQFPLLGIDRMAIWQPAGRRKKHVQIFEMAVWVVKETHPNNLNLKKIEINIK